MKNFDRGSAVFCFLLSFLAFVQSLRLGIGTPQNPGMGFIAFAASGLLGLFSIALFIQASLGREKAEAGPAFSGMWKKVVYILIVLVVYAKFMPIVGYLISTFLLMSFLFWVVRGQKWWSVVVSSFLITLVTYYVFSVWLNCQFPAGFFGL